AGRRRCAAPRAPASRASARADGRASRSHDRASAHAGRCRRRAAARARARAGRAGPPWSGTLGRHMRRPRTRAGRPRTPLAALSAEAALELLVRHAALSLRLDLEQLELPTDEARAPNEHTASVDETPRTDVRRQRAYAA